MRRIPVKRILKIAALSIATAVSLVLLSLFLLPTLVSSSTVQSRMQKALSASMKRQVAWSKLVMTWSGGLTLSGFKLGSGPAPLLNADIDQILIDPSLGRGADGRFGIDLMIKIRNVRAELAPSQPKAPPPPSAKDPLTLLAESVQRIQELDFPLPVDLRILVDVAPLQVDYLVAAPGKSMRLQDFSFNFTMPSLAAKPIAAVMNGLLLVDGREVGKVGFNAKVTDLVTRERRIHLASALIAVDAAAPGTTVTLSGGLGQADGFAARCRLNLPALLAAAQPFIPAKAPKISGKIDLLLLAKVDNKRDLHATLTIDGNGLAASGGPLKAKRAGPLDLKLVQKIDADHVQQRVDFPGGVFAVPGLLDAAWSASVNRPTVPKRSLDITFGPLRLDLARAIALAAPFLPPGSPVRKLEGEAFLNSLKLKMNGPDNNGTVALSGLGVKLPQLQLVQKEGTLNVENIEIVLDKAASPLVARQPTKLTADLLWSIRRASFSGARPISLKGAHGTVGLVVDELDLKSKSPRKISASAVVTQSSDLEAASVGTQLLVNNVHKQLRLLVRAEGNGDILASLPEFAVTVAALSGNHSGKRFGPIPLSASLTASELLIPADKKVKPSLQRAAADISAGDFLRLAGVAALTGGSSQQAVTSGTLRLGLRQALLFAAPFVPSGLKGDGVATASWDLAAPLPDKPAALDKHPLRSARAVVSLFDKLELALKLDNISATVPTAKGAIKVVGLRTKPDLRLVSTRKGAALLFDGGVQLSAVSGLPGAAGKLPSQQASILFNGDIIDWSSLRLHEELRVDPLAVSHEAELNVNRFNLLLDEQNPFTLATLTRRLDATLFATVEAAFSQEVKQLLPGFDIAGNASGSARIDLSAGREIALRSMLKTKDFGVRIENGTKIEGMRSDIVFNRVYALAAAAQGDGWTPLSSALVRPAAVETANPGAAEIAGRIHEDLRGDLRGTRSFSIRRVTTRTPAGVPLVLTSLEGDLLFTQEKTGLSFFQGDLLGGTLLARGVFDLKPEVPVIAAAGSFSNLDVAQLLPKDAKKRRADQDAEITGELSLTAPLTAEQRELFEQLRLALNIRKIGADTIERALFSLDPYERNEQVVAQRKMLRLGNLKGLRATAVDGSFSMEGEVQIKGIAVDLPKVERLRISELPQRPELVKNRKTIKALRGLLDLVRADTLVVGPKGEILLKRRMYAQ